MVAAFGEDASAKFGPLISKFEEALSAAGGVDALASQVRAAVCETACESEQKAMPGKLLL